MPQRIFFNEIAKAQLRRIDRIAAMRILLALARLVESDDGDVKALEGFDPPQLRQRVRRLPNPLSPCRWLTPDSRDQPPQ